MRPTTLLFIFAASSTLLLVPATADACSPIYFGDSEITEDDTPECLTISGMEFFDDGWEVGAIAVQNDCDQPASFDCIGDGRECGPIEVSAGQGLELRVPSGTTTLQWTIVDESGLVSFRLDGEWGDCGGRNGCAMAQGSADDTQSAPMALVLAAFGLFVVRKRRA
ncbi:MAG: hypothetical protein ACJAYU_001522 [Bradymonadia bacterium]|jgi:hypothetical protein